ncbi:MAG: Ldh family oxidoreductase [Anaerolineales bacterium]|nr:Ldh family oxidoreductase [Anaerolineales bacterium]
MTASPAAPLRLTVAALRRFLTDAFLTAGLSHDDAATAADVLALADEFGVSTHGVKLLPGYLRRLAGGGARPAGRPRVLSEGPAWALVDGDSALGVVIGPYAMRLAIAKAQTAGIAYVGVHNGGHFGAIGYFALLAARAGLVGIATANDIPSVVAPGSRQAVLGTNPLAYAVPAGRHPPILLDMALSTVAGGKVYQARALGRPIPNNWIVGLDGQPSSDAGLYPEQASLVPAGSYKGFGLALLVETLSGLLSGAAVTHEIASWMTTGADQPTRHGAGFVAIDPAVWGDRAAFLARVDGLIDEIHAARPAAGVERIVVPGEHEFDHQRRVAETGVTFSADVAEAVRRAAQMAGLSLSDYEAVG